MSRISTSSADANKRRNVMKKAMIQMSLLMAVTMSLFLSFTGSLQGMKQSGEFSVPGFIASLVVSFIISLIIGFIVPMHKVTEKLCGGMERGLGRNCLETLISDVIYTPIITIAMVAMNRKMAVSHAGPHAHIPPFAKMLVPSLIISMVVGYVLIFIFQPIILRYVMKKNGVGGPPDKR